MRLHSIQSFRKVEYEENRDFIILFGVLPRVPPGLLSLEESTFQPQTLRNEGSKIIFFYISTLSKMALNQIGNPDNLVSGLWLSKRTIYMKCPRFSMNYL